MNRALFAAAAAVLACAAAPAIAAPPQGDQGQQQHHGPSGADRSQGAVQGQPHIERKGPAGGQVQLHNQGQFQGHVQGPAGQPQFKPKFQPQPHVQAPTVQPHPQGGADRFRDYQKRVFPNRSGHSRFWDGHADRPQTFNRRDYEFNRRAHQRFRIAPYVRPNGWFFRRWTFGMILPSVFWTENYWISDYWMYGLAVPPYGCEWVRYGDDALLVDVRTGRIVQVVYGVFY